MREIRIIQFLANLEWLNHLGLLASIYCMRIKNWSLKLFSYDLMISFISYTKILAYENAWCKFYECLKNMGYLASILYSAIKC